MSRRRAADDAPAEDMLPPPSTDASNGKVRTPAARIGRFLRTRPITALVLLAVVTLLSLFTYSLGRTVGRTLIAFVAPPHNASPLTAAELAAGTAGDTDEDALPPAHDDAAAAAAAAAAADADAADADTDAGADADRLQQQQAENERRPPPDDVGAAAAAVPQGGNATDANVVPVLPPPASDGRAGNGGAADGAGGGGGGAGDPAGGDSAEGADGGGAAADTVGDGGDGKPDSAATGDDAADVARQARDQQQQNDQQQHPPPPAEAQQRADEKGVLVDGGGGVASAADQIPAHERAPLRAPARSKPCYRKFEPGKLGSPRVLCVTDEFYFDISIGGIATGRFKIGVFGEVVPKSAANFRALATCTGAFADDNLCFRGDTFHRVVTNFVVQGGSKATGKSIYGATFREEVSSKHHSFLQHAEKGVVSWAEYPIGSQFFVLLRDEAKYLDGNHVVFGVVTDGLDVLDKIHDAPRSGEEPLSRVQITECGDAHKQQQ